MRILWLCNLVLPELSSRFGLKIYQAGGWLTGLWNELKKDHFLQLGICIPIYDKYRMNDGNCENYNYYSFHADIKEHTLGVAEERFVEILEDFKPDVIHIWGTEYLHSWAMTSACRYLGRLGQVVVHIQGLVSVCALHYGFGLSDEVKAVKKNGRSIQDEIEDFKMRGKYEIRLWETVQHAAGRTEWDRACVRQINPKIAYYHCGEILRKEFYENDIKWDVEQCKRHSIFISQAIYPVKGFHLVLDTMARLRDKYPDLLIHIAGTNLLESGSAYADYVCRKIDLYNLWDHIVFTGTVTAEEMIGCYRHANVFLSASTIENSSNSICEALRIGVPVVSSFVGGVMSLIEHEKTGFLYPLDAGYMQQYYIEKIFDDDACAMNMSKNAAARSKIINNKKEIVHTVSEIYSRIAEDYASVHCAYRD